MGNDDIMAILMLLSSPCVIIKGITIVNGVSSVPKGTLNLKNIFNVLKIKIPIVPGHENALVEKINKFPTRDRVRAEKLRLLPSFPTPTVDKYRSFNRLKAEDFIYNKTRNGNISVIALGPLTNIAKAILKYGDSFCKKIDELFIMGGGLKKGNVSSKFPIEYNIFLDPEAANIVFKSKIPTKMIGADSTSKTPVSDDFVKKVRQMKTINFKSQLIKEIILNNNSDFNYFYDQLTACIFLNSSIITENIKCSIKVELNGKNRGQTTIKNSLDKNVEVVMDVNSKKFYKYILNLFKKS